MELGADMFDGHISVEWGGGGDDRRLSEDEDSCPESTDTQLIRSKVGGGLGIGFVRDSAGDVRTVGLSYENLIQKEGISEFMQDVGCRAWNRVTEVNGVPMMTNLATVSLAWAGYEASYPAVDGNIDAERLAYLARGPIDGYLVLTIERDWRPIAHMDFGAEGSAPTPSARRKQRSPTRRSMRGVPARGVVVAVLVRDIARARRRRRERRDGLPPDRIVLTGERGGVRRHGGRGAHRHRVVQERRRRRRGRRPPRQRRRRGCRRAKRAQVLCLGVLLLRGRGLAAADPDRPERLVGDRWQDRGGDRRRRLLCVRSIPGDAGGGGRPLDRRAGRGVGQPRRDEQRRYGRQRSEEPRRVNRRLRGDEWIGVDVGGTIALPCITVTHTQAQSWDPDAEGTIQVEARTTDGGARVGGVAPTHPVPRTQANLENDLKWRSGEAAATDPTLEHARGVILSILPAAFRRRHRRHRLRRRRRRRHPHRRSYRHRRRRRPRSRSPAVCSSR